MKKISRRNFIIGAAALAAAASLSAYQWLSTQLSKVELAALEEDIRLGFRGLNSKSTELVNFYKGKLNKRQAKRLYKIYLKNFGKIRDFESVKKGEAGFFRDPTLKEVK